MVSGSDSCNQRKRWVFSRKSSFSDSQRPWSKYTFLLPPKKSKWNKINCLREEKDILTGLGGIPTPQNGAGSQPLRRRQGHEGRSVLHSTPPPPGPPPRALFLFPRPWGLGRPGWPTGSQHRFWLWWKARVQGSRRGNWLSACSPAPHQTGTEWPSQNRHFCPSGPWTESGRFSSVILKRETWTPCLPSDPAPAQWARCGRRFCYGPGAALCFRGTWRRRARGWEARGGWTYLEGGLGTSAWKTRQRVCAAAPVLPAHSRPWPGPRPFLAPRLRLPTPSAGRPRPGKGKPRPAAAGAPGLHPPGPQPFPWGLYKLSGLVSPRLYSETRVLDFHFSFTYIQIFFRFIATLVLFQALWIQRLAGPHPQEVQDLKRMADTYHLTAVHGSRLAFPLC